jgi:hypothetical protein
MDIKNDIGDCDLPVSIVRRRTELTKYKGRLDRIKKEL